LKLKCDEVLSNFAFKFNLRRFIEENSNAYREGAKLGYFVKSQVGRCRLTLSNPSWIRLKISA